VFQCKRNGVGIWKGPGANMIAQCTTKGKTCVYTQSKRGGSRIRKKRVTPEALSDNNKFNQCTLSILPDFNQGNISLTKTSKTT
jgi:hypothetical protein